jgi:cytosine/adenosine deaminase-related metal-dependent hydrolase
MTDIHADWLLARPGDIEQRGARIRSEGAQIASVHKAPVDGSGLIALPGLANAHDHARAFRATPLGGFDKPLESWLFYLGVIPGVDPYLTAATSLARSAMRGVGRVMVHYTRMQGLTDPLTEAKEVARAARHVGVKVGFALPMRDRQPLAYADNAAVLPQLPVSIRSLVGERLAGPLPAVEEQMALAEAIAQACHGEGFNVQYGPTGVQWCSDALIARIAEASEASGRQVHMHLLETRYQREWADRAYPGGIVHHLKSIGLLSPRLTLAHCAHARPDELELIADAGAVIAVNTSSNLGIRSGIAPVGEMLKHGCKVAMGLDGLALDEDDDALREMRLLYHLHKGWGYEVAVTPAQGFALAARHGRQAVSGLACAGTIEAGEPADLLLVDGHALMEDRLFDDVPVLDFVLARANAGHIKRVIVGGTTIVENGRALGVDYDTLMGEMMAQLKAKLAPSDKWRATVQSLDAALKPFYLAGRHMGCG